MPAPRLAGLPLLLIIPEGGYPFGHTSHGERAPMRWIFSFINFGKSQNGRERPENKSAERAYARSALLFSVIFSTYVIY
jgi:hypothetical protein